MGLELDNQNEEQKQIKQKILEDLFEAFLGNIAKNQKVFPDMQSMVDMSFSILIIFNRDMISHIIKTFNLEGHRKQLMKDLFGQIKEQINNNIKRGMM